MRILRVCGVLLFLVGVQLLFECSSSAQTPDATVTGQITDQAGRSVPDVKVVFTNLNTNAQNTSTTLPDGTYRMVALRPGIYRANISKDGFQSIVKSDIELHVQDQVSLNFSLQLGSVVETVTVEAGAPLLNTESANMGAVVDSRSVQNLPLNGRNYLDLLQVVPGVNVNRQQDQGSDGAVPVLGERGNNTNFLIDGLPNRDDLNGGASAQFNEDSIAEFRVDTTGYKAEFGHASGGVVNVITRSGTNNIHGNASLFHRNNAFDSSDVSGVSNPPFLLRWDFDGAAGGPMVKDKAFWFASAERIREVRTLNFQFPPNTPQVLQNFENSFNQPDTDRETRLFAKFDQAVSSRQRLTEEVNFTNAHIANFNPLSNATGLPSTRTNNGDAALFAGISDTALLGDSANYWVLSVRGGFRRDRNLQEAAHAASGPATFLSLFSGYTTGLQSGDLGFFSFGSFYTPSTIHQEYGTFGVSLGKSSGPHNTKFGYDFVRTRVDGTETSLLASQLFATAVDFAQFGPVTSGLFLETRIGGVPPTGSKIRLRNNYSGLFVQDDWRLARHLTVNLGLRWDYDSAFAILDDFSPRLGFAWAITRKTVLRGSWGYFYDHFRLGLARDISAFGGASLAVSQPAFLPRLFYGIPTNLTATGFSPTVGFCLSPTQTDAQLAGAPCTIPNNTLPPNSPTYGVDHLSNIVAPGHAPIPANTVVTSANVQNLTGLSPQQFADQASVSIGKNAGFFEFSALNGFLDFNPFFGPGGESFPFALSPGFATPYTSSLNFGIQRQITSDFVVSVDFYHKDIRNILGVRQTNLTFANRIDNSFTGFPDPAINGYGPWFSGSYNAGIISFEKRLSHRFSAGGSYTYASENDDLFCSSFRSDQIAVFCYPTDSFVGTATLVTDPVSGKTNANGSFFAMNGNFVPKAGTFFNGPTIDQGPSDLALRHVLEAHGTVQLPWKFEISSLFRVQTGFPYTQTSQNPVDEDGNNNFGPRDLKTGRNAFVSPHFINMDIRFARTFAIGERLKVQGIFEFFNIFNIANPAAVQTLQGGVAGQPFGSVAQRLPGREGQIGLRITF
jgi:hypothetical protein